MAAVDEEGNLVKGDDGPVDELGRSGQNESASNRVTPLDPPELSLVQNHPERHRARVIHPSEQEFQTFQSHGQPFSDWDCKLPVSSIQLAVDGNYNLARDRLSFNVNR